MIEVAFRHEVLKLNKKRIANEVDTPEKVFGDLLTYKTNNRGEFILDDKHRKQRKMLAFYFVFDGAYDVDHICDVQLLDGDQWLQLQPREHDLYIQSPRQKIVVPRVVMGLEYEKINESKYNKSYNSVYELYGGVCAVSKRKLKKSEGSKDHVIPLDKGGADELHNIVLMDKELNNMKGNRYNHECGLPDVVPIVPRSKPNYVRLRQYNTERNIPEWTYFLGK